MKKEVYIPRQIESPLKKYCRQFPAVALTGPRQSGKSTTLQQVFGKRYQIISFDDPLWRERALTDPKLFLDGLAPRVILDEIQYVPELLADLKIRIDRARHKYGQYIITGSQQFNLIKNLSETLAGRIGCLTLLPFHYQEIRDISFLKKERPTAQAHFIRACLRGAFPEVVVHHQIAPAAWYGSYVQTYLERDIRTIYNLGSLREFHRFLQLLAGRCAQPLHLSAFASDLGVAVNTIKNWVSILEASQIIYLLPPYYRNLGKRITKNPKVYFLDGGLVSYLVGLTHPRHILNGPLAGALFENYCIQETVKYFYHRAQRPPLFYLRTHNGLEVDLLIEKNMRLFPFEIKLTKSPAVRSAASLERFQKVFAGLRIRSPKLITLADETIPLTRQVTALGLNDYFQWLGQI